MAALFYLSRSRGKDILKICWCCIKFAPEDTWRFNISIPARQMTESIPVEYFAQPH